MKVLVTGAAGNLGAEVLRVLQAEHVECLGVDVEDFDVRDGEAVHRAVEHYHPDAIVHCAAYTDAERAETEPEKCAEINGMGTLNVVRAALAVNAKLLYVSDAAVFSGEGSEPWEASDRPNARCVYGLTKAQGEEAVRSLMTRYFIIRSSWLYGDRDNGFVQSVRQHAMDRTPITAPENVIASPTPVSELAELICQMIRTERYGVYHAACQGSCSKAELARTILRLTQGGGNVRTAAARHSVNACLSTASLTQNGFAPLSPWEEALSVWLSENR